MERANSVDQQYLDMMEHILSKGTNKRDRTGVGTRSVFGQQLHFDMQEGFPLLTSKKMYTKGIIVELLWFLGKHMVDPSYAKLGRTNIRYLLNNDCNIWVGDAYKAYLKRWHASPHVVGEEPFTKYDFIGAIKDNDAFAVNYGDLGPVYGKQWCDWGDEKIVREVPSVLCDGASSLDEVYDKVIFEEACEIPKGKNTAFQALPRLDQISALIQLLKDDPDSRRLLVSAWNVSDLPEMVLPPCHYSFQCYTREMTFEERVSLLSRHAELLIATTSGMTDKKIEQLMDLIGTPKRKLSLLWSQRSCDLALGIPFNIASYGFLLSMLANLTGMVPGELIGSLGDTHIYNNQTEGVAQQLANPTYNLPKLKIKPGKREKLTDYNLSDFVIEDYVSAGNVSYPLSN